MSQRRSGTGAPAQLALRVAGGLIGLKVALVAAAAVLALLVFIGLFITAASSAVGQSGATCAAAPTTPDGVPANYVPWLERAVQRYGLGPRGFGVVAAVHDVESDFGRSDLPGVKSGANFAGAQGPGQFLAETWAAYGVDADGDGVKDPYGIPDSILATANYLRASGAPQNWHDALFAYNHSEAYVQDVLAKASGLGSPILCAPTAAPQGEGLERIESVARWIESRRLPYCWGGGHGPEPGPSPGISYCWTATGTQDFGSGAVGLDCSGATRWLLVLSGYPDPGGIASGSFAGLYEPGPGRWFTIWSNAAHVFVTINGRDWGTSETNFAHGPGYADHTHAGFTASHPEGL